MDVSGKKEQRKETELDECWLKFTRKVIQKQALIPKSCTLLLFEVLREFAMERVKMNCWRRWREWIARKNDLHGGFKWAKHDGLWVMIVVRPVAVLHLW